MERIVLISCAIFKGELEYLLREKALDAEVLFLDAALHVNFDRLKARLTEALERYRDSGRPVRVLYGNCHPEILRIVERYGARKIKAVNCIEAMAGADIVAKLNREAKSFFLTAGWVNNWETIFQAGTADLNIDFTKMFSDYKRVIVFDAGVVPIDENKVEQFRVFTGLPVERRQIDLEHLAGLMKAVIASANIP